MARDPAIAFARRVRDCRMSTLVGPAGLADRVSATLRAAGEAPMVYTVADLCHHERGRIIVAGWRAASDVASADYRARIARADERDGALVVPEPDPDVAPQLVVFDLRGPMWRDVARALYQADQAARTGALVWCCVMTSRADDALRCGEDGRMWPEWRTRAADLGECAEASVLLAELPR